ncbi:hypothetical protein CVT25_001564 [Psilocybe cyanescens]|uniref:G-protein coupled receptors family 1 profile domain-containing protein n=1 Tax=Psilocybe cyanescens TaxID=93625 RepID=A0A409WQ30_PSICY|nr:hypothetical protein CVT25_001564 [Psilocybe cyanescens]
MSAGLQQFATQEPPELHWFERANYIAVNVGLIAYGMNIIAVCACTYYLIQEKNIKKNAKWLVFIFILFACGTGNIAINMTFNEWAWIDFREYPGGPLQFLLEQQSNVVNTWGNAISTVVGFLTDALLIYRVHVVYQRWYVIVIPILSWIAMLILGALFITQAARPNSSLWSHITLNFSLPYFSIAMATNILLTGMLVVRLLYMRHKIMKAMDRHHGKTYTNIVSMVLESAVIYGVISFIFLVLYTKGNTAALLFIPLLTQVQCISPILILLRVARGRAWSNDTVSKAHLSDMKYRKQVVNINSNTTGGRSDDISLGTFQASPNKSQIYSSDITSDKV